MTALKERTQECFAGLQDAICRALETADGAARFREDRWQREGGGGGRTRIMENGAVFEKAGVNFSAVEGVLPEEFAKKLAPNHGGGEGLEFFATGVSLVLHPRNPYVPTVHANFRYLEKLDAAWFGGGADLTPYYPFREDVVHCRRWRAGPTITSRNRIRQKRTPGNFSRREIGCLARSSASWQLALPGSCGR